MKDWTEVTKRSFSNPKGNKNWHNLPMIIINKSYMSFNKNFCDKYLKDNLAMRFLYVNNSKDGRFLGIRIVPRGDETVEDFRITHREKTKHLTGCNLPRFLKEKLKDVVGKCFHVIHNEQSNLIEIDLSKGE